ncbi:hypothetical protein BU15DRAFT_62262 [Melanogaster broomeanus]|nr:hypothetical protein BU15DRAFT_62262 [Melanogaster broomeanus]
MGPRTGIYRIISAVQPHPCIGADSRDRSARKRVIADGDMNVKKCQGNTRLSWPATGISTEEEDNVVVHTSVDPGTRWLINEAGSDTFTIERDSLIRPNKSWTLGCTDPMSPVNLEFILALPRPDQQWRFERIRE